MQLQRTVDDIVTFVPQPSVPVTVTSDDGRYTLTFNAAGGPDRRPLTTAP